MPYEINQVRCSRCHCCQQVCPEGAIEFQKDAYHIAEARCVGCARCVEVCHSDAIYDPEQGARVGKPHPPLTMTCDVLVIGAGAAGLAAAAKAAEMGKSVLVIEKNREIGGCAWYADGLCCPEDDAAGEATPLFDGGAAFFNWLERSHGTEMHGCRDRQGLFRAEGTEPVGRDLCQLLLSILLRNGGRIFYRTAARELVTDGDGGVRLVLASDPGGAMKLYCECCVLTTGTLSRNADLREEFGLPGEVITACGTCTGDGIKLARRVGADMDEEGLRVHFCEDARFSQPVHRNVQGGILIDERCHVLRDGQPIPGLYAAGDTVCDRWSCDAALAFAFASGYIVGVETGNAPAVARECYD